MWEELALFSVFLVFGSLFTFNTFYKKPIWQHRTLKPYGLSERERELFITLASKTKEPHTLLKDPERFIARARALLKSRFELYQEIYDLKVKLGFTPKNISISRDIEELQPGFLLVENVLFKSVVWQNCNRGIVLMLDKPISDTFLQKKARFTFLKDGQARFCLNTQILQVDSKTALIAHSDLEASKTRAYKRVCVNIPAKATIEEELVATITDLSLGGAGILLNTSSSPSIGSSITIRFSTLELKGVIRHSRTLDNGVFVGIEFQNLDTNSAKSLSSILSRESI
ncbi:MAG: PilZ domain-containing protein [Aquificaceae bacterium]